MSPDRTRVLVVGARVGSLGSAVATAAGRAGYDPYEAGITGEAVALDVVNGTMGQLRDVVRTIQPRHVVCTVGLNMPEPAPDNEGDLFDWYRWHFETNVIGPMRLLEAFIAECNDSAYLPGVGLLHYVAISSNSATIPRSRSAAYCASKAALSQALRVKGREGHSGDAGYLVYGYEPGLIAGTPMTQASEASFPGQPLTRMRGSLVKEGIEVAELAGLIVGNLRGGPGLNGTLIRYDAGEQ